MQQSIELALVDPLTGLNNRRFLENHLALMVDQAQRRRAPLALMILDIDHFKRVNDTYGHDAGDEVLKGFADRLRGVIRGGDLLCRLGGEEFVIVMPNVVVAAATQIAERAAFGDRAGAVHHRQGRPHDRGHRVDRRGGARAPTAIPNRSTGAPTGRSTAPSPTGATASAPTRRDLLRAGGRPAQGPAAAALTPFV